MPALHTACKIMPYKPYTERLGAFCLISIFNRDRTAQKQREAGRKANQAVAVSQKQQIAQDSKFKPREEPLCIYSL